MDEYTPDCWVLLHISGSSVAQPYYRVLAGWYGGYAGSDWWKLSSGVLEVIDDNTHWTIPNHSGSVYRCAKNSERLSSLTTSILQRYMEQNSDAVSITQVPITHYEN